MALARSLVLAPDVLLLDEPLSALDPNLRKQLRSELKSLQRRVGITFLFVTHDQEEALSMSDRIGVMHAGVLEQVGTPEEIYLRPRTRFVAGFLGAMNWLGGIGVRPEAVRVSAATPVQRRPRARRTVVQSNFLGNCLQAGGAPGQRRSAGGRSVASERRRFAPGDRVHVWWHPADELSFRMNRLRAIVSGAGVGHHDGAVSGAAGDRGASTAC